MDKRAIFNRPRLTINEKLPPEERQRMIAEISEAQTVLAFYRTPKGENRCLYTGLCFDLFMFLIVMVSRNIPVFNLLKTLVQTIEKIREGSDAINDVCEAVDYLKLNPNKNPNNELL